MFFRNLFYKRNHIVRMTFDLLEKLNRMPRFYLTKLNHAKDKMAFYWDKTGRLELYVMDIKTHNYRQISNGDIPRTIRAGYVWTRDDKSIVFARDVNGDEQHNLYSIEIETGDVTQITDTPKFQEYAIDTSPDGTYLLFSSTRNGQVNLFKYNLKTAEIVELTNFPKPIQGGMYSKQNDYILFGYNDTDDMRNLDTWIMDIDGSNKRKLISFGDDCTDGATDISNDGKYLGVLSNHTGNYQLGVYSLETGKTTWLSDGKYEMRGGKFTNDNKHLIALRNMNATIRPLIFDIKSGEKRELKFPPGIAAGLSVTKDDKYLIVRLNSSIQPSTLVKYNLENDEYEELISPDLSDIPEIFFVKDEYVEYETFDGLKIGAVLYKPKNLENGKKYPVIVDVHGGPTGQYFRNFSMFDQVLVNEGYIVIKPNFRGSTGYGKEFEELNIKDIGGGDLKDIVAATEYMRKFDYVDSERIGIYGGSYGGYMTFYAMVKEPEIWKAGAAIVGITDWKRLYEESMPHFKYYLDLLFGKPEEEAELYEERSPINHIEGLKAPLLIFHGINDPRCPITQARVFRDNLIEIGWKEGREGKKTFEYVEYGDIGHGGSTDQEYRIRGYKTVLDFFKRRL